MYHAWNDTSNGRPIVRQETVKVLATAGRNQVFQIGYKNVMFFIIMYLVPLVILVMVSVNLMKTLKRRQLTLAKSSLVTSRMIAQRKKDDNITLVLVIIIAAFIGK